MTALTLQPFDVVVVPFPFTDQQTSKRRPALVISAAVFNQSIQHSVLAMITSAEQSSWLGDSAISDLASAGLNQNCIVRLKLFTLDCRLIIRKAGVLAAKDQRSLRAVWKPHLSI